MESSLSTIKHIDQIYKVTSQMNIRKGAGVKYSKIDQVDQGIFVKATEFYKGWYKINYKGNIGSGWAPGKYLEIAPVNYKEAGLVELTEKDGFVIDLHYATKKNFMGYRLYPKKAKALMTKSTAKKLKKANKLANKKGYKIKIWDAYRPLSVQWEMWYKIQNHMYVAYPLEDSKHSKGVSVDVTLVDRKGKELKMPTKFDSFSEKAGRSYPNNSKKAQQNMEFLTEIMLEAGFTAISSEWWHYNDSNSDFPTLDVPVK
ncbi:M15 family metallopeptidase [Rummeliibacillus pycnus]|uniref:M15 family metallopeptidase n=1 Tax=Rummeliibacillus pycnus TaxID=101070 RepID=UPI000C9A228A|nr:M15 family metallopeptidase [Rummeliibacillus pycnus]